MEIILQGKPVTEADVQAFEKRHQVTLPREYREFLLRHNGGAPVPASFSFPNDLGSGSMVATFFSLGDKEPADLDRTVKTRDWPEAYDLGILRIGRDTGGSGLFLRTKGGQAGQILFVDREKSLRKSKPVTLAETFEDLLEMLRE